MLRERRTEPNMAEADQTTPTSPSTVRGALARLTPVMASLTRFEPSPAGAVSATMRSITSWRVLSSRMTKPKMEARKMVSGTTEKST
jgi:hypothetical protein